MAAPTIRGVTVPAISTGAVSTPVSAAIGDLVLFFVWSQGTDSTLLLHTLQVGFTEIRQHAHNDGTTDGRLSVAYRVATADGVQSHTPYVITGATANQTSIGCVVLTTGTYDVGTLPTSNSATLTTNAVPNPPSVTGLTGDFHVFAIGAWHVTTAGATAATTPANYVIDAQNASASHVTHLAIASRALTSLSAATEDPGAFGDNVAPNGTVSMTIAIKGALPEIVGTGSVTDAADAIGATGAAWIAGTASSSDASDAVDATGTVADAGAVGTLGVTDGDDTIGASGAVAVAGDAAASEPGDAVAGVGAVAIAATSGVTDVADSVSSTAAVSIGAQTAATDAVDAVASGGAVAIVGAISVADAADVVSAYSGELVATIEVRSTALERNRRQRCMSRRNGRG